MTYYVYILQSLSSDRYYCGQTKNLEQRLRQHNDPEYRPDATTRRFAGPWILIWSEEHSTRNAAMKREHRIKGRGVKRFHDMIRACQC
ncbi:MAG: GIY-YIG nuclease family protein [Deltaproteobacteria bacterium]|nr:GIY-YIG nuclease family protein [Deltaproteobacteria bacterium]